MTSVERATKNELRFREANEHIEDRRVELGIDERVPYLCECEEPRCRELVRLSAGEYRAARVDEHHFLLIEDHPFRCGKVVKRTDGYMIVEKDGRAAEVIEEERSGMDERAERIGRNEALFRSINENLEDLNDALAPMTGTFEIVCECGALECAEQLRVTPGEYESVRADPVLFVIRAGHAEPDVEEIVGGSGAYEIVRKRDGRPARIARELDERSG
jgi:hypothetical protein